MKYMCKKHRNWLVEHPTELLPSFRKTRMAGRAAMARLSWDHAVLYYGNALEMSEIMLIQKPGQRTQQRYVDTAIEMMHALRNSAQASSSHFLFSHVLDRLEQETEHLFTVESLAVLRKVAFGSKEKANERLEQQPSQLQPASGYLH
jgi:hypothetical protein